MKNVIYLVIQKDMITLVKKNINIYQNNKEIIPIQINVYLVTLW